ncbi:DoxX family protein [Streptomyces sp. NPDC006487]|uniref:DoxX family protein n=1 Tax=Streptomyces sp. NPDC006487 TaxID=3364748 RepID=UPI00368173EC
MVPEDRDDGHRQPGDLRGHDPRLRRGAVPGEVAGQQQHVRTGVGFTPGRRSAIAAGIGEAGGGALLALGLATPAAGAAAAGAMAGAVAVHAPAGFFAQGGGFEYPALLGTVAACLGVTGPGRISLDHVSRHRLDRPAVIVVAFALSAVAATVVVKRRVAAMEARAGGGED